MKNYSIKILLLVMVMCSLCGCVMKKNDNKINNMKNILMVIAPRDFRDEEFNIPKEIFIDNGYKITVGSIQSGEAIGANGTKTKIDIVASDVDVNQYDAVVFVGGPGMQQILDDDSLKMLAQKFNVSGKLVSAICVAPAILAKAGLLKNKKATGFTDVKSDIENNGGKYIDSPVAIDGNIITANGPKASNEFAKEIIKYLQK